MAESADATDLKSGILRDVRVRPPPLTPTHKPNRSKENTIKKPKVQLTKNDGNVFVVIGICSKALKAVDPATEKIFVKKAFAAQTYDEVLRLAMEYCEVS